ncbi:hypothetical protein [Streptomyces sp. NPDC086023]|uniref:hypothetical protein n=1 Tax=Streptomyces sp. NPDC086023 TaxID=3365746 RepID=UPI0037CFB441
MTRLVFALFLLAVAVLLHARLAMHRRREQRLTERWAALAVDPYHAVHRRWWPEDDVQAAAARLFLDGLVTVTRRGNISVTPAGADPDRGAGHPLPDALLAALRRRTAPAPLGNVLANDPDFGPARDEFLAACRTRFPEPEPERGSCCLAVLGVAALAMQMVLGIAVLFDRMPRGTVEWVAAAVTAVALAAQFVWLERDDRLRRRNEGRDRVAERLEAEGPHPALVELEARHPETAAALAAGRFRFRRGRNHGRPRRRSRPPVD